MSITGLSSGCVERAGHRPALLVLFLGLCATSFLVPWTCTYIPNIINCFIQSFTFVGAQLSWEFRKFRCVFSLLCISYIHCHQLYLSLLSYILLILSYILLILSYILPKEDTIQHFSVFSTLQLSLSLCTLSGGAQFLANHRCRVTDLLNWRHCFWDCSLTFSCYDWCPPVKYPIWSKNRCLWIQLKDLLLFSKREPQIIFISAFSQVLI